MASGRPEPEPSGIGAKATSEAAPAASAGADGDRQAGLLRAITDNATTAIFLMDAEGRCTFMNPAAEAMTGFRFDEVAGKVLHDQVHHHRPDGSPLPMSECPIGCSVLGKRSLRGHDDVFVRKDGSFIPVRCSASPVLTDGNLTGIVLEVQDVTAERVAEERRRESEERFRGLMDQAPFSVQVLSSDGRTLRVNPAWESLWGLTLDKIPDYNILDDPQLEAKGIAKYLRRAFAGEPVYLPEIAYDPNETIPDRSLHDDPTRWVSAVAYPLKDAAGRVREVVLVHEDVTDRRRAEQAVAEKADVLSGILAASLDHIYVIGRDGRYRYVSAGGARAIGFESDAVAGRHWRELGLSADVMEPFDALRDEVLRTGRPARQEVRFVIPGADVRSYEYVVAPLASAAGEADGVVVVSRDVTDRRRAEEALRESERRYRALFDSIDEGFCVVEVLFDRNGRPDDYRFLEVNPAFERQTGLREAAGRRAKELAPDLEPHWFEIYGRVATTGESVRFVAEAQPLAGRWFDVNAFRVGGPESRRVAILFSDVSERRRAETGLRRAGQDARFLADASAALADLTDPESMLRAVARLAVPLFADWCAVDLHENGDLRRVAVAHADPDKVELAREYHLRYPPERDAPGGTWHIVRSGESELVPDLTDDMLAAGGDDPERLRRLRELGLRSYIGVPVRSRDEVLGVLTFIAAESGRRYDALDLAVAEDLARRAAVAIENARLLEEVRTADRRKDEFLAMLGHELRNPLAPIRSGLDLLKMSGAEPDVVALMSGQVEHLVRLVDDLLDVSRILRGRVELKRSAVDLSEVVRRAVETVRPMLRAARQEFSLSLPPDPVRLEADPVRLAQVVSNLLNNASKYTESGGRVELSVERSGGDVVLRVTDTGIGIDPELLPHVFDLFTQSVRTIDRSQGGLGLGLTIVKNLVEMHGGAVMAASAGPGHGSTFTVRLPSADAAAEPSPAAAPPGPASAARRILVVDDNVPAAKLLVRLLKKLGDHEVVTAHDGEGALTAAEAYHPDLILLDIGLPRMDGHQVARRLRTRPEFDRTLLVALTGYGTEEDRRRSAEAGFDKHVTKPPSVEALRAVLAHPKLAEG